MPGTGTSVFWCSGTRVVKKGRPPRKGTRKDRKGEAGKYYHLKDTVEVTPFPTGLSTIF